MARLSRRARGVAYVDLEMALLGVLGARVFGQRGDDVPPLPSAGYGKPQKLQCGS